MKTINLPIILALVIVVTHSQMSFNISAANYQVISGYWQLTIPVSGGVQPCTYNFQTIPATWIQNGNHLNIPLPATTVGGTWATKIIVTDALSNSLQRSLLININGGSIYIGDFPYNQTFNYSPTGAVTATPSTTTISTTSSGSSSSSSSSSAPNVNTFGNPTSVAGVIPLKSQGPGVNVVLPTSDQLDALINSGDVVTITQTAQSVIASTLSCTQKASYLYDFLGRIGSYITIKQSQASQIQSIITNSAQNAALLNSQIANYTNSITQLNLPNLESQLKAALASLQTAYNTFNAANVDLTPYNLNITANLQSINTLSQNLNTTNQQLAADNQNLANNQALIASLQQQLNAAKQNQAAIQARILQQQTNVNSTKSMIDALNAQNTNLNNKINQINTKTANLQANYQLLETQAQNLKNQISAFTSQQGNYTQKINQLKIQVQQDIANQDPTPLNAVEQTISSLNSTIPTLKQQSDFVKFNCNGAVNYTVNTLNGAVTYNFASSSFTNYVADEFGSANTGAIKAQIGPASSVVVTPLTIFSPSYVNQYGASFSTDLQSVSSSSIPANYQFASDFSCSTSALLNTGTGVVQSINSNQIIATLKNGSKVTLTLGACSNILLLNQKSPKVGNNICWNGPQANGGFQVISALLF